MLKSQVNSRCEDVRGVGTCLFVYFRENIPQLRQGAHFPKWHGVLTIFVFDIGGWR